MKTQEMIQYPIHRFLNTCTLKIFTVFVRPYTNSFFIFMNDYQQVKVLGQGGYGKAILARQKSNNKMVVIKEISISGLPYKAMQETLKEAKVLSSLKHPNIVNYIKSFESRGNFYIIMEYADGGDLEKKINERMRKGGMFTEDEILKYFIQLALAIKYIHDRKILHRDLKSQNVFLTKDGTIKLGDFGIAKVLEHTFQLCKTQVGTPYYFSPEICQGRTYNAKTDIWSLGCILYELCTFTHPFNGQNMKLLMTNIIRNKYRPINDKYSQNLHNLVNSMLSKDPSSRPNINQILSIPFIKEKLSYLLDKTLLDYELSHTTIHGRKPLASPTIITSQHDSPDQPQKIPDDNKKAANNKQQMNYPANKPNLDQRNMNKNAGAKPTPEPHRYPGNVDPRYAWRNNNNANERNSEEEKRKRYEDAKEKERRNEQLNQNMKKEEENRLKIKQFEDRKKIVLAQKEEEENFRKQKEREEDERISRQREQYELKMAIQERERLKKKLEQQQREFEEMKRLAEQQRKREEERRQAVELEKQRLKEVEEKQNAMQEMVRKRNAEAEELKRQQELKRRERHEMQQREAEAEQKRFEEEEKVRRRARLQAQREIREAQKKEREEKKNKEIQQIREKYQKKRPIGFNKKPQKGNAENNNPKFKIEFSSDDDSNPSGEIDPLAQTTAEDFISMMAHNEPAWAKKKPVVIDLDQTLKAPIEGDLVDPCGELQSKQFFENVRGNNAKNLNIANAAALSKAIQKKIDETGGNIEDSLGLTFVDNSNQPSWAKAKKKIQPIEFSSDDEDDGKSSHLTALHDLAMTINAALDINHENAKNDNCENIENDQEQTIYVNDQVIQLPLAHDQVSSKKRADAIKSFLEKNIGTETLIALNQEILNKESDDNINTPISNNLPQGIVYLAQQMLMLNEGNDDN